MLELRNISKRYETGAGSRKVLDGVNLGFGEVGFVCVLGRSGCGKTTLLNIIGGLDRAFEGDLVMGGASFSEFTEKAWDRYRASLVGFVFQEAHLVEYLNVYDNVRLGMSFDTGTQQQAESEGQRKRIMDALDACGIGGCASRKPDALSGGEQQRVAIARALVKGPQIVLADEPTGSLDYANGVQIMDLLADIARKHLVIVVTHDRELAHRYATRIIELDDGKVVSDTPNAPNVPNVPATPSAASAVPQDNSRRQRAQGKSEHFSEGPLTMRSLAGKHSKNKKGRTAITAIVASIGLLGMVLMLALNAGAQDYMARIASQSLLHAPIQVKEDGSASALMDAATLLTQSGVYVGEDVEGEVPVDHLALAMFYAAMENRQSSDLVSFMDAIQNDPQCHILDLAFDVQERYNVDLNVYDERGRRIIFKNEVTLMDDIDIEHAFGKQAEQVVMDNLPPTDSLMRELIRNERTGDSPYEVLAGRMPEKLDEIVIITNGDGHITDYFEYASGIANISDLADAATQVLVSADVTVPEQKMSYPYDELLGLTYRIVPTCDFYYKQAGAWKNGQNDRAFMEKTLANALEVKVVGIVKPKEGYDDGMEAGSLAYTAELMPYLLQESLSSEIVQDQSAHPGTDVFEGKPFDDQLLTATELAQIESDRKILDKLLNMGNFSQAKRDYVKNLTNDQVKTLRAMFGDYIGADGSINIQQSDIDIAASLPDDTFIAAVERYAPATLSAGYQENMEWLNASSETPVEIAIYAKSFENDKDIKAEIDAYNTRAKDADRSAVPLAYANEGSALMTTVAATIDAVSRALGALVAIALAVSVIMVFSVTYVSAIERKREIALLRALGASKSDVRALFNWENAIIGAIAGAVGAVVGLLSQPLVNFLIGRLTGQGLMVAAPLWVIPAAIVFGALVAVASGYIPARRASQADAAQALK
ncbi:MAG: ABC transporter ATP-binding protein/permease [Eggerthellaceae bacterium]|nr:ABC transporter ATP-binding protein/permease [Eggerthellaceae bacterium]